MPVRRTLTAIAACLLLSAAGTATAAVVHVQDAHAYNLGDRTMRAGDNGADVKALQSLLTTVGLKVSADGAFGAGTTRAVQTFQQWANVLPASGTAGTQTIAALKTAAAKGKHISSASQHLGDRLPLAQGMSGHDVRVLGDKLTKAGYRVAITTTFTAKTASALRRFEGDHQLTVDGVLQRGDIQSLSTATASGGAAEGDAPAAPDAPVGHAKLGKDGLAIAPSDAPIEIQQIIAAGNEIATKPYVYGGGHGSFKSSGYDCSGSLSYALHGGGLLDTQLTSGDLESWGKAGKGQWISIYANAGHTYMYVAGLRFDTSGANPSRWQKETRSNSGFVVRHPKGF